MLSISFRVNATTSTLLQVFHWNSGTSYNEKQPSPLVILAFRGIDHPEVRFGCFFEVMNRGGDMLVELN